jgi:predicted transcriptional regulator of viral defense system
LADPGVSESVAPHEDIIAAWLGLTARQGVVSHDTALALYELAPSRSREIHDATSRALATTPRPGPVNTPESQSI